MNDTFFTTQIVSSQDREWTFIEILANINVNPDRTEEGISIEEFAEVYWDEMTAKPRIRIYAPLRENWWDFNALDVLETLSKCFKDIQYVEDIIISRRDSQFSLPGASEASTENENAKEELK